MPRKKPLGAAAPIEISPQEENDLAKDLMVGAKAIANFIGRPEREVYYLASIGRLPIFEWGSKLAARRSTIRQHILDLEKSNRSSAA
jgi:hypothetical protein